MMFDNSDDENPTTSRKLGEHLLLAGVIAGALGAAIGMHFASLTVFALGLGHLVLAALGLGIRSFRTSRKTERNIDQVKVGG